jgi:hypothetical protein
MRYLKASQKLTTTTLSFPRKRESRHGEWIPAFAGMTTYQDLDKIIFQTTASLSSAHHQELYPISQLGSVLQSASLQPTVDSFPAFEARLWRKFHLQRLPRGASDGFCCDRAHAYRYVWEPAIVFAVLVLPVVILVQPRLLLQVCCQSYGPTFGPRKTNRDFFCR